MIAEFHEVCSFHVRDEWENTRFLCPNFEGCSVSVRQSRRCLFALIFDEKRKRICTVNRLEKVGMWMRNKVRNE